MERQDQVCSEVHTFTKTLCSPGLASPSSAQTLSEDVKENSKSSLAVFTFTVPQALQTRLKRTLKAEEPDYDSDGDVVVVRRDKEVEECVYLEHDLVTPLAGVGLQIWRGSLLLADYLLHNHEQFEDASVLELGSGTGLASLVAGLCNARVTATDIDGQGILERIKTNLDRNSHLVGSNTIAVQALDLFQHHCSDFGHFDVILAGDLIYDNNITDAFVNFISKTLALDNSVYFLVSLEKRYVFTVADLDTVAPAYDHFVNQLATLDIRIELLNTDFKQYFCYEKGKEMVLLKIMSK